jgi:hypothetical protein
MTEAMIVKSEDVPSVWNSVVHYVERTDGKFFKASDIYEMLLNNKMNLVLVKEDGETKGACIFKVSNEALKKILITDLGGDGADWNAAIIDFMRQLKIAGYKKLEIQGRKGWQRALKGFEVIHTTIGKEL